MTTKNKVYLTFSTKNDVYIHHAGIDYPHNNMILKDNTISFTTKLNKSIIEQRVRGCGDDGLISVVIS